MIKLTKILSELQVANPSITVEKVRDYYRDNIMVKPGSNTKFDNNSPGWEEYKQISKPYCIKYSIDGYIASYEFEKLSKPDLAKVYNQMRALVRKHVGKEILSELQIADPTITLEKVRKYLKNNIWNIANNKNELWSEYVKFCKPYLEKYHLPYYITVKELELLSRPDLTQFYKEIRQLVKKHVGTEILSELQVVPPGITVEKVKNYYWKNLGKHNKDWKEYRQLCKPYVEKYNNICCWIEYDDFEKLSKPDLNKIYNEMRALVQKHTK